MSDARRLLLLGAALVASACASPLAPSAPPPAAPGAERDVRAAWLGLPSSASTCPEHYDYFPDGGLAIFYCHARSLLTLERLERLAGMPSTRPVPAGASAGALPGAFRHYDPRFVDWLRGALLLARADGSFRAQTQPVYDRYVAPLARQFLATRRLMTSRRAWTRDEVRWVREAIERGELPDRYYALRYASFDEPAPAGAAGSLSLDRSGWDPNVGPTAVAFWLRRELDGSATAFTAALEELVSLYDAAWLRSGAGIVKSAASVAPSAAPFAPEPADGTRVGPDARLCGAVVEQLSASPYSFLRLTTSQGPAWIALRERRFVAGERVCIVELTPVDGYRSTMLKRTFDRVYFGEEPEDRTARRPAEP